MHLKPPSIIILKVKIIWFYDQIWDEQKQLLERKLPFKEKIKRIIFEKETALIQIRERLCQWTKLC